jgi:hypothetical protein
MHSVRLITLIAISLLILSGCTHPFEQVFCSAAGDKGAPCLTTAPQPSAALQTSTAKPQVITTVSQTHATASPVRVCPDKEGIPLYQTTSKVDGSSAADDDPPKSSASSPPPPKSSASSPSAAGEKSPGGGAPSWIPTPCEVVVVAGAINHCIDITERSNILSYYLNQVPQISTAAAGTVAALVGGATATPPLWIAGAAAAGTNVLSAVKDLVTGTPPVPVPSSMFTAASGYASLYRNMRAPDPNNSTGYLFYAGLWNAAGSVCPPNLMLGRFKLWKIDLAELSLPQNFNPLPPNPPSP